MSMIWIEHIVHALIAIVDRLVVLHAGSLIAQGDPRTVISAPMVQDIYMGIAADA
jgi:branched-chain amino acid transport system ATP-binding protein